MVHLISQLVELWDCKGANVSYRILICVTHHFSLTTHNHINQKVMNLGVRMIVSLVLILSKNFHLHFINFLSSN